jgi:hypothetical protein
VDLIETQRYMAVAGKLTRAVTIILLLAAKSVCYRTDGIIDAARSRGGIQFAGGDAAGMRTICRGASPQVSMAAWQ